MSIWEDIASSIKKLDPDHADVLLASTPNCLEPIPTVYSTQYVSANSYNDGYDASMMVHGVNYGGGDSNLETGGNCVVTFITDTGDPYDIDVLPSPLPSLHNLPQHHQLPQSTTTTAAMGKSVNMSGGFVCSTLEDDPLAMPTPTPSARKTPPPSYDESQTMIVKTEKGLPTPTPKQSAGHVKYNRRNNPDLEKRRIHFCDHPGEQIR